MKIHVSGLVLRHFTLFFFPAAGGERRRRRDASLDSLRRGRVRTTTPPPPPQRLILTSAGSCTLQAGHQCRLQAVPARLESHAASSHPHPADPSLTRRLPPLVPASCLPPLVHRRAPVSPTGLRQPPPDTCTRQPPAISLPASIGGLLSILPVLLLGVICTATVVYGGGQEWWIIGGDNGWSFGAVDWVKDKPIHAGEILSAYNMCTVPISGGTRHTSGRDHIKVRKGKSFFICSTPGHCAKGMKIAITA
ncbi:hypothetical protein HU200_067314 [Digitaria exilis]|uniref:Phytocyanin domain-containing protein n=1 Tax=Digitaria exilis TaxID=1010633 RepID=A0A835A5I2_9POAL|nr:hypothetical protein HU200_067314 [Digitaria exilis]